LLTAAVQVCAWAWAWARVCVCGGGEGRTGGNGRARRRSVRNTVAAARRHQTHTHARTHTHTHTHTHTPCQKRTARPRPAAAHAPHTRARGAPASPPSSSSRTNTPPMHSCGARLGCATANSSQFQLGQPPPPCGGTPSQRTMRALGWSTRRVRSTAQRSTPRPVRLLRPALQPTPALDPAHTLRTHTLRAHAHTHTQTGTHTHKHAHKHAHTAHTHAQNAAHAPWRRACVRCAGPPPRAPARRAAHGACSRSR
jgi:hypothetical protein